MPVNPFVPLPGVMQANVRYTLDGQKIENVLHFSFEDGEFAAAASEVGNVLGVTLWGGMSPFLSEKVFFNEIYITDQSTQDGAVVSIPIPGDSHGLMSGNCLPNSAALCATFRTAKRGRSFTGRAFTSGIPVSQANGSYVLGAWANSIIAVWDQLRIDAAAQGTPLVVASRMHNKAWRAVGIATPVTAIVARDLIIDQQRRRTPGRGT